MALEDSFLNGQFKWWRENPCYSTFCSESLDISPAGSWCLLQYQFTFLKQFAWLLVLWMNCQVCEILGRAEIVMTSTKEKSTLFLSNALFLWISLQERGVCNMLGTLLCSSNSHTLIPHRPLSIMPMKRGIWSLPASTASDSVPVRGIKRLIIFLKMICHACGLLAYFTPQTVQKFSGKCFNGTNRTS